MEVTISPDAEDAYAKGHITLIEKGCVRKTCESQRHISCTHVLTIPFQVPRGRVHRDRAEAAVPATRTGVERSADGVRGGAARRPKGTSEPAVDPRQDQGLRARGRLRGGE